jgi:hypothetical protein
MVEVRKLKLKNLGDDHHYSLPSSRFYAENRPLPQVLASRQRFVSQSALFHTAIFIQPFHTVKRQGVSLPY